MGQVQKDRASQILLFFLPKQGLYPVLQGTGELSSPDPRAPCLTVHAPGTNSGQALISGRPRPLPLGQLPAGSEPQETTLSRSLGGRHDTASEQDTNKKKKKNPTRMEKPLVQLKPRPHCMNDKPRRPGERSRKSKGTWQMCTCTGAGDMLPGGGISRGVLGGVSTFTPSVSTTGTNSSPRFLHWIWIGPGSSHKDFSPPVP